MMKVFVLASGSKGNSTLICFKTLRILLDDGLYYSELKRRLETISYKPSDIDVIIITHDHSDHIKGLPVFLNNNKPLLYVSEKIDKKLNLNYERTNYLTDKFMINNVLINSFPLSHDSTTIHGFTFECENESLVYITDTGYLHTKYYDKIRNKNYYIIESNHDVEMLLNGIYPDYLKKRVYGDNGHISNIMCGKYLSDIIGNDTKKVILAHLSQENNTPSLALSTVKEVLKENNIKFNNIKCAQQEEIEKVVV